MTAMEKVYVLFLGVFGIAFLLLHLYIFVIPRIIRYWKEARFVK